MQVAINDRFLGQYLLPSNISTARRQVLDKILETYMRDVSDKVASQSKGNVTRGNFSCNSVSSQQTLRDKLHVANGEP